MTLYECISGIPCEKINRCTPARLISGIQCDSRTLLPGEIFVCIKGCREDGNAHVDEALWRGCSAVVTDRPTRTLRRIQTVPVILVPDTRRAYALLCRNFYGCPDRCLVTVGITGTKGKTSTAWMIYSILRASGRKCGMIGTTGIVTEDGTRPLQNTTPEPGTLYRSLRDMVESGCTHVVMEISSQALMQHRTEGLILDYGLFTNLSPDHIGPGEHGDFFEYAYWKTQLLARSVHALCLYRHAELTRRILRTLRAQRRMVTFGEETAADYVLEQCSRPHDAPLDGLTMTVRYRRGGADRRQHLRLPLFGTFQANNALAAFACTREMGCALANQCQGLAKVSIPGRGQLIYRGDFFVMIDYAHNGESLQHLLTELRRVWKGRLVCLFGCGGNRSPARRLEMGRISGLLADETILTEDNSRNEPTEAILADLERGIQNTAGAYRIIPDRAQAIRQAVLDAIPGELLVLAGKGHEEYMEHDGIRTPFSERRLVRKAIRERIKEEGGNYGTCDG